MNKGIDTSIQDWAPNFMDNCNDKDQLILPATITPLELAKYVSGLANDNGGNILLGAYSGTGYGAGFQNVESELVNNFESFLEGVELKITPDEARLQNIYLFVPIHLFLIPFLNKIILLGLLHIIFH